MENGKIKEFQKEDAVGAVTVGPSSCLEQGTSKAEPSPLIPDKSGTLFYPAADAQSTICSTVGHGFYTSIYFHLLHTITLLRMVSLPHSLAHTQTLGMAPTLQSHHRYQSTYMSRYTWMLRDRAPLVLFLTRVHYYINVLLMHPATSLLT